MWLSSQIYSKDWSFTLSGIFGMNLFRKEKKPTCLLDALVHKSHSGQKLGGWQPGSQNLSIRSVGEKSKERERYKSITFPTDFTTEMMSD